MYAELRGKGSAANPIRRRTIAGLLAASALLLAACSGNSSYFSSNPFSSTRVRIAFLFLFVMSAAAAYFVPDLGKLQERMSVREGQAILQGITDPSQFEDALRQHPSNNILRLIATAAKAANDTKGAIDRLSAQIEPAGLSKEINVGSASRDDLEAFRRDLRTAEANATAFLPRYGAIFKAEHDQVVDSYSLLSSIGRLNIPTLGLAVAEYDPRVHFDQVKSKWIGLRTPSGQ